MCVWGVCGGSGYTLVSVTLMCWPVVSMQVQLPVVLDPDLWALALEQMLLFVLIIGRWILPKGNISRSQLSLLLLVYIGMASDIMDVFVLFEEPQVLNDELLGYVILSVWSLSLVQFCLVLTVTKGGGDQRTMGFGSSYAKHGHIKQVGCCHTEIWSILATIFMQDFPFLAVRLWVMIKYKTFNYSLLFFSFKNALVICVQLYRLCVVCGTSGDDVHETNAHVNEPSRARRRRKRRPPDLDFALDPRYHGL